MKKIITSLAIIMMLCYSVTGQNVAKQCVLFEIFTGVNCPYCPAAANGVAQMMEEGLSIAPLGYQTSAFSVPEFYTSETNARANYYGITGYPTLICDGLQRTVGGGGSDESMYSYYKNLYNNRIGISSPFTIALSCGQPTGTVYPVTCTVNKVGTNTSTNLRIFIVLTQCHIQRSWQGMSTLEHVVRDMIPNQNGTVYNGGTQTVNETFDLGTYPKEDCYLTAWVQDYNTKEVFQAVRLSLDYADYDNDLLVTSASDLTQYNCSGITAGSITVKNYGSQPVTSFDIIAKANGQELYRKTWHGDTIKFTETTKVQIPEINIGTSSKVTFSVENPNGQEDQNPTNNSKEFTMDAALNGKNRIILVFKTDSNPEQDTVTWKDMTTGETIETLTFDHANKQYVHEFYFTKYDCYRLTIHDSGNDGIKSYFTVYDNDEHAIFNGQPTVNPFNTEIGIEFEASVLGIDDKVDNHNILIYPNPSKEIINLVTGNDTPYQVSIYDICGRKVYENAKCEDGKIGIEMLMGGIYTVKINNGKSIMSKKIVVE